MDTHTQRVAAGDADSSTPADWRTAQSVLLDPETGEEFVTLTLRMPWVIGALARVPCSVPFAHSMKSFAFRLWVRSPKRYVRAAYTGSTDEQIARYLRWSADHVMTNEQREHLLATWPRFREALASS